VPDVRPYLAHARLALAPLRIARGVQNKVLEALAMGRPVVATGAAVEGLAHDPDFPVAVADDPQDLAARCAAILQGATGGDVLARARRYVEVHYRWETNLARFDALLEPEQADAELAGEPAPPESSEGGEVSAYEVAPEPRRLRSAV
jgi:glycosyltransferase involved in cell wall biosynthesis